MRTLTKRTDAVEEGAAERIQDELYMRDQPERYEGRWRIQDSTAGVEFPFISVRLLL